MNNGAEGASCATCYWARTFPWYVRSDDGWCAHPDTASDPLARLTYDDRQGACKRYLACPEPEEGAGTDDEPWG